MTRAYRPLLARIGLTYPQYLVMLVLWQDGERAVHEIATRLALPAHGVTPLVHRLEYAGLVTLRRARPDRRVVRVSVTAAGSDLERRAAEAQRSVACRTQLAPAELAALREQLHDMVEQMTGALQPSPVLSTPSEGAAS